MRPKGDLSFPHKNMCLRGEESSRPALFHSQQAVQGEKALGETLEP